MVAPHPLEPTPADLDLALAPTALVAVDANEPTLPTILHEKIERAAAYAKAARAGATRRAYYSDWAIFTTWCTQHGLASLRQRPMLSRFLPAIRPLRDSTRRRTIGGWRRSAIITALAAIRPPPPCRPRGVWPRCSLAFARNTAVPNGKSSPQTRPHFGTCWLRSKAKGSGRYAIARSWRSAWPRRCGGPRSSRFRSSMWGSYPRG